MILKGALGPLARIYGKRYLPRPARKASLEAAFKREWEAVMDSVERRNALETELEQLNEALEPVRNRLSRLEDMIRRTDAASLAELYQRSMQPDQLARLMRQNSVKIHEED